MNTTADFHPAPLPDALRSQLAAGEQVLWHGRPPQGFLLRDSDVWLIPFSCIWGGFAVFWQWQALSMGPSLRMALFGLPFVLIGLYVTVGRFWVDARLRARTHYALTNERVLLAGGWGGQQIKALPLRNLPQISLKLNADGGGLIQLGEGGPTPLGPAALPPGWPGAPTLPPRLELPADTQRVLNLIQNAQRQSA